MRLIKRVSKMEYPTSGQSPNAASISGEAAAMLNTFWPDAMKDIRDLKNDDFKQQILPLARIKKIMKLDEDVKMISAEAPVLFAKAAEIFISELSLRAWIHTEDNKRRTLQRNDIAMAISKFDQFDFLIDIVPRDELKPTKRTEDTSRTNNMLPEQIQYYLQLAQQQAQQAQQQQQQQQQTTQPTQQVTTQVSQPTQIQLPGGQIQNVIQQPSYQIQSASNTLQQPQVIQIQAPSVPQQPQVQTVPSNQQIQQVQVQQQQQQQQPQQQTQVYQQVITASGEVQNVPIQLTPAQLQAIQMQLQGKQTNQNVIIQQGAQPAVQTVSADSQFNQQMFQIQQLPGQSGQQIYIQQSDDQTDGTQDVS
ncbi:nuclear transcription factor Y subunit gamma-like isoform X1 [Mytilus galloprovincialis]|uniref:nuclear transcription factor Y subunit gamma-like isoform X1 n=2 Tax=Mytilus galloprovincialis TaxID=29158 RepID=UPI003F7C236B